VWAPSGREFAFISELGGKSRILFQSESGSIRPLALSAPELGIRHIEFSPDGQRLGLDAYQPKHRALVVSINGGVPVDLDPSSPDAHGATFSPDGAWIAYTRYANGASQLTRISSSGGGRPIDLTSAGVETGDPIHWSPAGDGIGSGLAPRGLRLTRPMGKHSAS
jgi:Tol biopolymer transport system component